VAYRLKAGRPVGDEVRRLIDKQLALAISRIHKVGDSQSADEIHEARRHVKKVRALLRLVRPGLGDDYPAMNRRLRIVSGLLAPVADGEAAVDAFDRLVRTCPELSEQTAAVVRAELLQGEARAGRKANISRVPSVARRLLRKEQARAQAWTGDLGGRRTVTRGLERTARRARRAMLRASMHPTTENYHVWRRRVKDHWLQVRVIQERCGNRLRGCERRLEGLDGVLGEYHNCALLIQVLLERDPIPRREAARVVRLIRRMQADLRRRALAAGTSIYKAKPADFVKRVKRLWKVARTRPASPAPHTRREPWPRVA
jgi:CHAD domain-containing protein